MEPSVEEKAERRGGGKVMGWFNRLCISRLTKAQAIVKERIGVANAAISLCGTDEVLAASWRLHHAKMRQRCAELSERIAYRQRRERFER
jgi:hypothetical protein